MPDDPPTADWLGLRGARVLVAGAGGIGGACAEEFARVGARVLVVDADGQRAEAVASALGGDPADRAWASADLRRPEEARHVVDSTCERWGGIDVCLHAIGINIRKPAIDFEDQEWIRILEVNLNTAYWLAREAGRRMVTQGAGSVVLLSSVSGLLAHRDHAPYAASKGAINQMARVMAAEWAGSGVTVNAVAPGYVETDLTSAYLERGSNRERLTSQVPAGRLGTPGEVTGAVLFLASPRARFVTGHVLYVDGGRTLV